jgi:hypothetical protein
MKLKIILLLVSVAVIFATRLESASIMITSNASPRIKFGAEKLVEALKSVGEDAVIIRTDKIIPGPRIWLNQPRDPKAGQ